MELIPNTTYYTDEGFAIVVNQKLIGDKGEEPLYLGLVFLEEEESDKKYILPVLINPEGLILSGDYGTIKEMVH